VASRRLRSDLRTFRRILDPAWRTGLSAELRWMGDVLGAVRDRDVEVMGRTIEGLTLRITSVRQYDGTLSIVPNGSIQVTSNKTRGWGRAIVDVRVALTEDPDRVRESLEQLLEQLADEEPLKSWLREAPSVLGVVQLTDVAQVERVVAQTTPGNRLEAERFLRERITARITEQGIKVPPVTGAVASLGGTGVGL